MDTRVLLFRKPFFAIRANGALLANRACCLADSRPHYERMAWRRTPLLRWRVACRRTAVSTPRRLRDPEGPATTVQRLDRMLRHRACLCGERRGGLSALPLPRRERYALPPRHRCSGVVGSGLVVPSAHRCGDDPLALDPRTADGAPRDRRLECWRLLLSENGDSRRRHATPGG